MSKRQATNTSDRITALENQMDTLMTELKSMVSNLASVTPRLNIPLSSFVPGFPAFPASALLIPTLATPSPIALSNLLFNTALTFTGPNTLKGPIEESRKCDGTRSVVLTERFGKAVTGGRRIITVTNSGNCRIIVTAEAPGGAPVENPVEADRIDTLIVAPGATDALPVILVKGEQLIIQCPNTESIFKPPCSYAYRIDRVPAD